MVTTNNKGLIKNVKSLSSNQTKIVFLFYLTSVTLSVTYTNTHYRIHLSLDLEKIWQSIRKITLFLKEIIPRLHHLTDDANIR